MSSQLNVFMPRMFAKKIWDEARGVKVAMTNEEFESHLRSSFVDMFLGDFAKKINVRSHTDTSTGEMYFTAKVTFGYSDAPGELPTENIERFFNDVIGLDPELRDYVKLPLPQNRFWKVIMDKKPMKPENQPADVLVINAYDEITPY